jgi:glycosyltransferase involved in cell wall biosynthesis
MPAISVIMPVYNSASYLGEAILSILGQSFTDFEFIIIDDGSTDNSISVIRSFDDDRIKIIELRNNHGNYTARNIGLDAATGKYLCVMDSDDVSVRHRLEVQFNFLENNPDIGICGSLVRIYGTDSIINRPLIYDEINTSFLKNNYCTHPSLMMRSAFLKEYNLRYNDFFKYAGDYELVSNALKHFKVVNLPEVLLEYRLHKAQISQKHYLEQQYYADKVRIVQLLNFGIVPSDKENHIHLQLLKGTPGKYSFHELKLWGNLLLEKNYKTQFYNSFLLIDSLRSLLKSIRVQYKKEHLNEIQHDKNIQEINQYLQPVLPLPFHKPWAVLPDFISNLLELTKNSKPSIVAECGSGLSTLVLGYLVKNNSIKQCIAIEHERQFYESTKLELIAHGLDKYVNLIYAPLTKVTINKKNWLWYNQNKIKAQVHQIDLLIVDGPPGQIQKYSRYPAIPILKKYFTKNTVIILDDSHRPDEQEIIELWLSENPEFQINRIETNNGMAFIKQTENEKNNRLIIT